MRVPYFEPLRVVQLHYMARPLSFRWDEGFVARVDAARGDVPRSVWVRRAVEQALGVTSGETPENPRPASAEQPGRAWHEEVLQDGRPVAERPLSALDAEQARREAFARAGRKR